MNTEIIVKPQEYGLPEKTAQELTTGLNIPLSERKLLIEEFNKIKDKEITKESIKEFRALRLKVAKNRTQGIVKWHKNAKDYFLKGGQFVDAIKRKEIAVNEEIEKKLLEGEKYFERLEQEKRDKLAEQRKQILNEFEVDENTLNTLDLGFMEQSVFDNFLLGVKTSFEKRKADEEKARKDAEELQIKEDVLKDRKESLKIFGTYVDWDKLTIDTTDEEYQKIYADAKDEKENADAEKERLEEEKRVLKETTNFQNKVNTWKDERLNEIAALTYENMEDYRDYLQGKKHKFEGDVPTKALEQHLNNALEFVEKNYAVKIENLKTAYYQQLELDRIAKERYDNRVALLKDIKGLVENSNGFQVLDIITTNDFIINVDNENFKRRLELIQKEVNANKQQSPDKEKIDEVIEKIAAIKNDMPKMNTELGISIASGIQTMLTKVNKWIIEQNNKF